MNRISFKKIAIAFFVIFLMSRSRRIMEFFSDFDGGGILTLEPLRRSPEMGRHFVTLAILFLCFIILWHLFLRRR